MRIYTLEAARAALEGLRPVLVDIQRAYVRLRTLQAARSADARAASGDGHLLVNPFESTAAEGEAEQLEQRLRAGVGHLESVGVELKDPARGLIDFYHEREGEVVYLCYHLAEDDIGFWHPIDSGFAGRQPL